MKSHAFRLPLALVLALVLALFLAAAGCGSDDEETEPVGEDLTTLQCPMERAGSEAGATRFEPAANAFDTSELIGLEISEAAAAAAEHGCEVVVSIADGEGQPVPVETNLKAIYVYTEDDVVTQIEGVGGGI
jgi:hypothetical protein